jgi:hypothetical protein
MYRQIQKAKCKIIERKKKKLLAIIDNLTIITTFTFRLTDDMN